MIKLILLLTYLGVSILNLIIIMFDLIVLALSGEENKYAVVIFIFLIRSIIYGTRNPGVTRKPDNTLKGIWYPVPEKPDNICSSPRK